jgi:hypothetical protein
LREEQLLHSRRNPNPLGQLTPPDVALGYMISGDEGLNANRFFFASGLRHVDDWVLDSVRECQLFRSMPRHTMFPIFILFALLGRNRFWAGVLAAWSLLFFALFAVLFAHGVWAF